ncbi:phosphoribosyltransferase-like predicted ribonucleoside biosynthesis protein [Actinocorallia herbida]|uniref:Phosphoribosyltransferase-like predicted ribonucleoside biosynthesis protein n=1 Tax=Actinocorallia herbida TaxID=58109 RepID=A0A3N1CQY2_9ACTN|nr:phosphoribosyltransferase family protein [Actinocorallia herbida]ROO83720.1 phosphoribosyltransferase-like predicted ribonucleoside biosynthesis protein [Actinocorallia herbida]
MSAPVWPGTWVTSRLGLGLVDHASPVRLTLAELVGLAVRRNPRRAHLLVSTVLGKHVPTDPRLVYGSALLLGRLVGRVLGGESLTEEDEVALRAGALLREGLAGDGVAAASLRDLLVSHAVPRDAVVLGYAETATALGHGVADALGHAPYLHSTRRPVPGVTPYGGFEEEHSHATSHLLLPDPPELFDTDAPLVLVDDELSTGRTVRNTLRALHAVRPRARYVVASLIDLRDAADRTATAELAAELGARVDVVALAHGTVTLPPGLVEAGSALVAALDTPRSGLPPRPSPAGAATPAVPVGSAAPVVPGAPAVPAVPVGSAVPGVPAASATPASSVAFGTSVVSVTRGASVVPAASDTSGIPAGSAVRAVLEWPAGVPSGGRHGFRAGHREALEKALPGLGAAVAAEVPSRARRVLVLGFEELMYTPLRLAEALADLLPGTLVRYSTTTRSPVLAVDDPGYAIRGRVAFPAHDTPADGPGERYAYNVAQGFDAIVLIVDEEGDTPLLHDGLLTELAGLTGRVVLAVVPA